MKGTSKTAQPTPPWQLRAMAAPFSSSMAPYGISELAGLADAPVEAAGTDSSTLPEGYGVMASSRSGKDEEARLWARFLENKDPEAREQLIVLHLPYAKAVAGTLYRQHAYHELDFKDYVQWATLGLIEAVDKFDPARGAQFRTYAYPRMLGSIRSGLEHGSERHEQLALGRRMHADRLAAIRRGKSLDNPAHHRAEELLADLADLSVGLLLGFMLEDTTMLQAETSSLPDAYESMAYKSERRRLHALLDRLTPREQSVIRLHYLQELKFQEIADALGISKSQVSQLHEQAMQRLRLLMEG